MKTTPLLSLLVLSAIVSADAAPVPAAAPAPALTKEQIKSLHSVRKQRVDLLEDELRQCDARIEQRMDGIVDALKGITDSKDSRTKVAGMKEETGKRLIKVIQSYDQKRAALKEELRNPKLYLTEAEKRRLIAAFDARIEKRVKQVLELHKSMPAHQDYERYRSTGSGYWGSEYHRNPQYDHTRRMDSRNDSQRDAMVKQLDAGIARLDRQERTLKTQLNATAGAVQRKNISEELTKTSALLAERRKQRLEALAPTGGSGRAVSQKEAIDLDQAMQAAINGLRTDVFNLFYRYNTYLSELSALHAWERAMGIAP